MKYSDRGKINPFDSYMAGFAPWITPRQIIILDNLCEKYIDTLTGIEKEAFLDFSEQIKYEANIKRKRYLNQTV